MGSVENLISIADLYLSITASTPIEGYRSRGNVDSRGSFNNNSRILPSRRVVLHRTKNEYYMCKESIYTVEHERNECVGMKVK